MRKNESIKGLDYSIDEIFKARNENKLFSFDLELSKACNLRCLYCYASSGVKKDDELTIDEIISIIDQTVQLGAEKIVIIGGGEPLIYPDYWKVLDIIRDVGLSSITFTNGTMINREIARRLFDLKEDIALKFNSFNEQIQDNLAGNILGTGKKIKETFKY